MTCFGTLKFYACRLCIQGITRSVCLSKFFIISFTQCMCVCMYVYICFVCMYVHIYACGYSLGLSDYRDSTRHRDSLGLFTIMIVDCPTI